MNKIQKLILSLQIITVILAIAFISIVSYFIIDEVIYEYSCIGYIEEYLRRNEMISKNI